jgi:hypothetical protein
MKSVHHLAVSALALLASILSGCAGATRLPMRTKGPAGETLQNKQLDLAFLDTPGTQRQEVLSRLSMVDTAYANPQLFWGRWRESKWGYWWFVASQGGGAGDAKRVWHVHNLLVSFDENGAVRKKEVIDNDASLWPELHAQLAAVPPLDLSAPVAMEVSGYWRLTRITLARDSMEFDRSKGKRPVLQISARKIVRFSHGRSQSWMRANTTCHTLHFEEKTEWGKSVMVCADAANVATLFQYLQQAGSPTMRWD